MSTVSSITHLYSLLYSNLIHKPKQIVRLMKTPSLYKSASYYPELPPRGSRNNFIYQVMQIIKYGFPNDYFFMYGMDVKSDIEREKYVNYAEFMKLRDKLNNIPNNGADILRNKLYFYIVARSIGIDTPEVRYAFVAGKLFSVNGGLTEISFNSILSNDKDLFCKELNGECGKGVHSISIKENRVFIDGRLSSIETLEGIMRGSNFIMQDYLHQHHEMNRLYPNSVNTIRLVTVQDNNKHRIVVFPSILRIGANGAFVDNTSQGGIAVGFNLKTGQLNEFGFFKPQYGRRVSAHPNSGVVFSDFHIPFIEKAVNDAVRFHELLGGIHSIGWDIAIGDQGPVFIEGNDNWEINGPQVGNHGFRDEINTFFKI